MDNIEAMRVHPVAAGAILVPRSQTLTSERNTTIRPSLELTNMSTHLRTVARNIPLAMRSVHNAAPEFYKAAVAFYKAAGSLSEATRRLSSIIRRLDGYSLELRWIIAEFSKGISINIMACLNVANVARSANKTSWERKLPLEPSEKSFTCFMKFPPEIRFMVWEKAADSVFDIKDAGLWTACKESSRFMGKARDKMRNYYLSRGVTPQPVELRYRSLHSYGHIYGQPRMRMQSKYSRHILAAVVALNEAMVKGRKVMNSVKYLLEVNTTLAMDFGDGGLQSIHQIRRTIQAHFEDQRN